MIKGFFLHRRCKLLLLDYYFLHIWAYIFFFNLPVSQRVTQLYNMKEWTGQSCLRLLCTPERAWRSGFKYRLKMRVFRFLHCHSETWQGKILINLPKQGLKTNQLCSHLVTYRPCEYLHCFLWCRIHSFFFLNACIRTYIYIYIYIYICSHPPIKFAVHICKRIFQSIPLISQSLRICSPQTKKTTRHTHEHTHTHTIANVPQTTKYWKHSNDAKKKKKKKNTKKKKNLKTKKKPQQKTTTLPPKTERKINQKKSKMYNKKQKKKKKVIMKKKKKKRKTQKNPMF